jgi:YtcA family
MKVPGVQRTGAKAIQGRRDTWLTPALLCLSTALAGCGRSPTFNIMGSFFPAWLICMFAGILLAALSNRVLAYFKLDREIAWSIVVYPCLALFFACALWLIFFS